MTDFSNAPEQERTIGLLAATLIGVGAIVGGGILVLAGTAFRTAGPGAILAFAINGAIAFLTVLSFAEISSAFPQSGGAYLFAKKVLDARAAFVVGWVLWFAYIVAGVLYALGFAEYAAASIHAAWPGAPGWIGSRTVVMALAVAAVLAYAASLLRSSAGGGDWATWGKLVVFAVLVIVGLAVLPFRPEAAPSRTMSPLLPNGTLGLLQAMGFTFIALQGFEIIAAVAGEVKEPSRTIPRAMALSLGLGLAVYLPLLFVVSTVGVPAGDDIQAMAVRNPETVMADAVGNYLGPTGFWLVMTAAVLSTLSALQANILAASRVALTMAQDRALPPALSRLDPERRTPVLAIYATVLALVTILFMLPDLAAAGAAASLIFLLSFALAHGTSYLARRRSPGDAPGFRTPWFPAVPVIGGLACLALAAFQAIAVPAAGGIMLVWLALGGLLYVSLFARRAQAADAYQQATDLHLNQLRGQSPLVLVPVANPDSAPVLVSLAAMLAPPEAGKVVLMNVVNPSDDAQTAVEAAERVLGNSVRAALAEGHRPEAMLTVAESPWAEIARVSREHKCWGVLLGTAQLDPTSLDRLEGLMDSVDAHVAMLFAPPGFAMSDVRRILTPVGGRGGHYVLRARVLASLCRNSERTVRWLQALPEDASAAAVARAERQVERLAHDATPGHAEVRVVPTADALAAIVDQSGDCDLMVLGLHAVRGKRRFGSAVPKLVQQANCATLVIARRD